MMDEREWRRERLGLAPDSAKAMEREGVGRVGLANLCFSDQDWLESVFGGGISTSTADYTTRQIKANKQIIIRLFSMLCRNCRRFMEGKKKIDEPRNQDVGPPRWNQETKIMYLSLSNHGTITTRWFMRLFDIDIYYYHVQLDLNLSQWDSHE